MDPCLRFYRTNTDHPLFVFLSVLSIELMNKALTLWLDRDQTGCHNKRQSALPTFLNTKISIIKTKRKRRGLRYGEFHKIYLNIFQAISQVTTIIRDMDIFYF